MMTKEEAINLIIDDYKNGNQSAMGDYCYRTKCNDCPFDSDNCTNESHNTLIDCLLKAEEKKDTNLKHYIYVIYMNDDVYSANLKESAIEDFNKSEADDFYKWLLSPYEEPKPTYKLTQFGYDLLKCCDVHCCIYEFWLLDEMYRKGYFKGIPTNVPIKDILDNCEVVEE